MITIQSSLLIFDEELGSFLEPFGKIAAIVQKPYSFAQHIDSGLRQIFLTLHEDVKATIYPGLYAHPMGYGGSYPSRENHTTARIVAPNTPKPKAAQLPGMTTMTNNRTAQPHRITHQKTIPDVQIQHNKQGTIQTLNKTPLLPKTRTAYNKNLQQ